jgi:type I restriction enzyme S subunit
MSELEHIEPCTDWAEYLLIDVARTTSGGTPNRSNKDFYNGTIPWVKSGELDDNFLDGTEEHISEEGLKKSSAKLFPIGTILMAMYGATVGKTAILKIEAATNQAICGIIADETRASTEFLRYQLIFFRKKLLSERYGGAQPNISQTIIKNIRLRLPSLTEQLLIAHALSTVQTAIEQQTRLIALTRELKSALMHKLFTEGLRGEKQKETEMGLVPERWEELRLEKAGDVVYGIQAAVANNLRPVGMKILTNKNITLDGQIVLDKISNVRLSNCLRSF